MAQKPMHKKRWKGNLGYLRESQFLSIHTDDPTNITVHQHCRNLLRYVDKRVDRVKYISFSPCRKMKMIVPNFGLQFHF